MKPTLMALFALSVAVFADDANRFQIITHINIDGSRVVLKLDRQTGKTWRYENRVGLEIIISDEGQALRERLEKIIIPRVNQLWDFTMEEAIDNFQAEVKRSDHLQLQKYNPVPKPNSSSGENNAQSKTNKPRVQPGFNGGNIGTNSVPQIPGGIPGAGSGRSLPPGQPGIGLSGIPTNSLPIVSGGFGAPIPGGAIPTLPPGFLGGIGILLPTGRLTNSLPMIPGGIPSGSSTISTNTQPVAGRPHGGLHLNIIIIPGEKLPLPGGDYLGIDLTTGMPIGGGAPRIDPTTGKSVVDSNSTGKLRPNRQPGGVGGERRNPMVDPTTGLPAMGGGLPGMGGGVSESIYELDPTTVKVKGIKSDLQNLSAFSLLHILLNSLDYPVQCIIDRHGIFLMPIGHPFIFLNGKPAETKNKSRWVLVGE